MAKMNDSDVLETSITNVIRKYLKQSPSSVDSWTITSNIRGDIIMPDLKKTFKQVKKI